MRSVAIIRHVPHEGPGTLADLLRERDLSSHYVDMFDSPPERIDVDGLAGLIVMGGPMNVDQTDRYPWLTRELGWIRHAVEADVPTLGICLGSQLLAKAHGAAVFPGPVKEIGWFDVDATDAAAEDRLFHACGPRQTVFQWHGDTFDLPAGAVLLARSELFPCQAFRLGRYAWALQFHVEVTAEIIASWLDEPGMKAELAATDGVDARAILAGVSETLPRMLRFGQRMLRPFVQLCAERSASR